MTSTRARRTTRANSVPFEPPSGLRGFLSLGPYRRGRRGALRPGRRGHAGCGRKRGSTLPRRGATGTRRADARRGGRGPAGLRCTAVRRHGRRRDTRVASRFRRALEVLTIRAFREITTRCYIRASRAHTRAYTRAGTYAYLDRLVTPARACTSRQPGMQPGCGSSRTATELPTGLRRMDQWYV